MRPFFKILLAVTAFLISGLLFPQGGPGGVGSSATNILWLDGNRGITLSAGQVTSWADQSGNGFNAVPSSTAARPNYVTNSVNGYPSLDFDGTNDELWINHNAAFNLTQWHFFIVPIADNLKNFNAWLTKGNDGQENFEMLSYNDGNLHTPIYYTDATRTFPSTAGGQVSTTAFNIIEYSYSAPVGRDVYKNYGSINTDNENKTPSNNTFSVYIGNEKATTGRFLDGDLAEVIAYNAPVNSAQRIIVNNYLAAKYNCTLTANDLYTMDNAANGNYDHDVAGIGRVNSTNIQNDSQGSGIVRILNPSGMGDGEYYIWGHDNGALGSYSTTDVPSGVQARLLRIWRGSEVGTINSFDIRFDLTGLGAVTAGDLRLLIDTDNDGVFSDETTGGGGVISGASLVSGNVYQFTGATGLNDAIRFTLGTINKTQTPLPIELVDFKAVYAGSKVMVNWTTATEHNSDYFAVERSNDGVHFETVSIVKGAGNSNSIIEYHETDYYPLPGISYYRIKQTDYNRNYTYSKIVAVNYRFSDNSKGIIVFPNPSAGEINVKLDIEEENVLLVLRDIKGREYYSGLIVKPGNKQVVGINPKQELSPGTYIITAYSNNKFYSCKLIIK